jgi:hypothetical protein
MGMDLASCSIALGSRFIPSCWVASFGLVFHLSLRQGFVQGLLFGDELSDFIRVNAIDQATLLRHFLGEVLT